ncbi:class I SAM-dependent methyltransferase [Candidatus Woesearchaeota archaeon]|nr:class I SAM-dependent methyltransferase [Candidatus Woesearchaeota archaeon]
MSKKLTSEYVKKEYNRQVKADYGGNYEYNRWFASSESKLGYEMHKASQKFHTKDITFKSYLEFGVGPGTWTEMFVKSGAKFTLLDISKEMLNLAKKRFKSRKNIKYVVGNMLNLRKKNEFDFVFSSRAIKYIPNKEKLFKVIYDSMKDNGNCVVINQSCDTFMQRIYRLFGIKSNDTLHQGGITISELKRIFKKTGFKEVELYPVEIKVGIPGVVIFKTLSKWIWKMFYKHELNFLSTLLSGSYLVKMKK